MVSRPKALRSRLRRDAHRGVVALWTLLMIPVMVVMFAVVVEGVNLWLARVELENALEAAALAAVKDWAEESPGSPGSGWTSDARDVGVDYAGANTINQAPVVIGTNLGSYDQDDNLNENDTCDGHLVFGAVTASGSDYVFNANAEPSCASGNLAFAVRAQATYTVPSLVGNFLGIDFRPFPFTVKAGTTAMYDCALQRARLIRVEADNFTYTVP